MTTTEEITKFEKFLAIEIARTEATIPQLRAEVEFWRMIEPELSVFYNELLSEYLSHLQTLKTSPLKIIEKMHEVQKNLTSLNKQIEIVRKTIKRHPEE